MKTGTLALVIVIAASFMARAEDLQCASHPIVSVFNGNEVMTGCIVSNTQSVVPNKPFLLGLLLRTQPGWHAYSASPGEAGIATSIEWQLPPGFTLGKTRWPKSKQFNYAGVPCNILDNEALIITEVIPPKEIKATDIVVHARVAWGCDGDRLCLMPVQTEITLGLTCGKPEQPVNAELFAKHVELAQK